MALPLWFNYLGLVLSYWTCVDNGLSRKPGGSYNGLLHFMGMADYCRNMFKC